MTTETAVVVGVGAEQGLGAALCRRFAAAVHYVLVAGRTLQIHRQHRSAWPHEIDLRPYKESF
jgi:NAD(P)-dependent dehydrogenase (short-subunit alcohol dehydrogenase family)